MKILTLVLVGLLLAVVVGAQVKCTPEQREWIINAGKNGLICEVYGHSWQVKTVGEWNKEVEEWNKEGSKKDSLGAQPGEERVCRICGKIQHLQREDDGTASWLDGEGKRQKRVNFDETLKEINADWQKTRDSVMGGK